MVHTLYPKTTIWYDPDELRLNGRSWNWALILNSFALNTVTTRNHKPTPHRLSHLASYSECITLNRRLIYCL